MDIFVRSGAIQEDPADAIIISVFENSRPLGGAQAVDAALDGALSELIEGGDFSGKEGQVAILYPRGAIPARRVLVTGLGKTEELAIDTIRRAVGAAATRARDLGARQVTAEVLDVRSREIGLSRVGQAMVEGSSLALYEYPAERQEAQGDKEVESLTLIPPDDAAEALAAVESGARTGERIAAGVDLARTLVNHPSNIATPTLLGETAQAIAKDLGLNCQVHDREWAEEQGMGAFLAVAQGAGQPPRFIVLEYCPPAMQDVGNGDDVVDALVLVGKAITFDSGGISLKPGENMYLMKGDMGGGGAVLGAMKAIGAIKPPVRVIGLVPATDNMPDGNAYKPGDVVRAMNGKTIEIRSTDAEGRMILADALCYAAQFDPAAVVDVATLTGACVVALGKGVAAGCFSTDDALRDRLMAACKPTAERLWPMPLFEEYREALKSDVADMVHSAGRHGGVGTSAVFLKEFTDYPWGHLDIAGMAFNPLKASNSYTPKGATGYGVRLLVEFVLSW